MKNIEKLKKEFAELSAKEIVKKFGIDCERCANDPVSCKGNCRGGNMQWLLHGSEPACKIVTWSGGTAEEIGKMIEAANDGEISLSDYWHIGDKRTVKTSAYTQVTLVLADETENGYVVVFDECAFIARMNVKDTNCGGYKKSRLAQLLIDYYNLIGDTDVFKFFRQDIGGNYLIIPTEKQIFGECKYSGEDGTEQFEYYKKNNNRIKKFEGSPHWWWLSSPDSGYSYAFCLVRSDGSASFDDADFARGVAPFGRI